MDRVSIPIKDLYLSLERRLDRYLGPPQVAFLSLFASRAPSGPPQADPRRILLVKLHGIGNIVLLLPVIRRLKRRFPDAEIDFLSFRTNAGILEGTEELSRCHFLDRGTPGGLISSAVRAVHLLRARRYDLAIDFDQFAHISSVFTLLSGAPCRIGFRNPTLHRHLAYTTPVVYLDTTHVSRTFGRLAAAAGAPDVAGLSRSVTVGEVERNEAARVLAEAGVAQGEFFALLHPGSSENLKLRRWPADRFSLLGKRLRAELGCRILVSGGVGEKPLAEEVARGAGGGAASVAGKLSVRGFAALCEKAAFVVSNDTAAVHVASSMGTPVVGLYGPNTPLLYGPLGGNDLVFYLEPPCSPCLCNLTSKVSHCRRALCMEEISVDSVFGGIRERYFRSPGALARGKAG